MRKIVIIADAHLEAGTPEHWSYKMVKRFIASYQPDEIIINGDLIDFSYLSVYNERKELLRESKRLQKDIFYIRKELDFFESHSKKILYLEGNHEYRLTRTIEKYPNIAHELLEWDKLLNINYYIPESEQPIKVGKYYIMHGKRFNKYYTAATLLDYGENIIIAHAHRIQQHTIRTLTGVKTCYGLGSLLDHKAQYLNGKLSDWANGFGILLSDRRVETFYNILISKSGFIWDGKVRK